jgi:hypothetical protein
VATILFTDADGTWKLWVSKPHPGDRFSGWGPQSAPVGDVVPRLSDGLPTRFRTRSDYGAPFNVPLIPAHLTSNLLLRSEEFDNASWTKSDVTVSANQTYGADGTVTADFINEAATTSLHYVEQTPTLDNNTSYRYSIFVRPSARSWIRLAAGRKDGTAASAFFSLSGDGAVGTTSGSPTTMIRQAGRNLYYLAIETNVLAGVSATNYNIALATADNTPSYLGVVGSGAFFWGAQVAPASQRSMLYLHTVSAAVSNTSLVDVADRLIYHLQNGGTCAVYTGDARDSSYATCAIRAGTTPQLALSDRRAMEFTLSLDLINVAASPVRMSAYYADQ